MLEGSANQRLDAIDGLRAVAILAVVAYHFGLGAIPSGYSGVDVFFVISGYVIARSLSMHAGHSFWTYLGEFYKRRLVRLLPALTLCLVTVSVLAVAFIPQSYLSANNRATAILAFFGLGNIGLLRDVDGYFGARAEHNPFVHTWSLGVEEQFYLLFPLLLWWWLRAARLPAEKATLKLVLRSAVPLLGLVSLGISSYETTHHHESAFYGLLSRFWELAAGASLLQMHATGRWIPGSRRIAVMAVITGWMLLLIGFRWLQVEAFPFPGALAPVIGTMLLISASRYAGAPAAGIKVLQARAATYIGRISYSVYLWHWPIACLFKWTVGFASLATIGMGTLLTFVLGAGSYYLVEQTFLRARPISRLPALRVAVVGVASLMVLAAGVSRLYDTAGLPFKLSRVAREPGWEPTDVSPAPAWPAASSTGSPRLFVLGDSHAWAYTGMVSRSAAHLGMEVRMLDVAGCPVANLMQAYANTGVCPARIGETIRFIESNARAGDAIFLASLRAYRLADQEGELPAEDLFDLSHVRARQQAFEQARQLVRRLQTLHVTIIIDKPKPLFRAPLFRCVDWFNRMNPVCAPGFHLPAALLKARDAPIRNNIAALQREFPQLVVWDPFPVLCPAAECEAVRDGHPLFIDQDHLSGYGNLALEQSFTELLGRLHVARPSRESNAGI